MLSRALSCLVALGLVFAASNVRADDGDDGYVARDMRMRSPALIGTGIGVATLGGLAVPLGALFLLIPVPQPECAGCHVDTSSRNWTGGAILAGGVAAIAAGIPMIIYGAHRVPVTISPGGPLGSTGVTLAVKF